MRAKLGIQTYRRARKDACERCGVTEQLCVHHKDENRYNNELSNLETLCRRCHQLHHDCAKNLPIPIRKPRPKRKCEWCCDLFELRALSDPKRFCSLSCARCNDHFERRIRKELEALQVVFVD
jgi:hypothetical protein